MIAVLLDIIAHPIFGCHEPARVAAIAQARVAHRLLQRGVQPGNRIRHRRGVMGKVGKFVAGYAQVAEQGVAENLGKLVGAGADSAARSEGADVDLVNLCQLEKQCGGDRPLVALEVVEIARADAKRRRHVGLRQQLVAAKAA